MGRITEALRMLDFRTCLALDAALGNQAVPAVDTGIAEIEIDSDGEPVRTVRRAAGSDVTTYSQRDTEGNWRSYSEAPFKDSDGNWEFRRL